MGYVNLDVMNYWNLLWLDDYLTGHKGFICGGCFKNILNKEKVKDLDIFFKTKTDWEDACRYFDEQTPGYGFDEDILSYENATWLFHYENSKVKAYKNKETGMVVELCCSIFGTPKEILDNFDFTITKFAYYKEEVEDETGAEVSDKEIKEMIELGLFTEEEAKNINKPATHWENRILCHENFFEHLHMHRLVIDDQILFPMSTLERMFRYVKYGYHPCKETKLKIAKALNEMDERTIEVSESLYDGMD